ncbi:unnamed protein product [Mytilus coruscus]|uniref:Reverse transcriptase RNase H-like domain-containing protein n=1 Tax=Mytilus coruscus TaxID=42192 RepID=A0A6J8BR39_MYTCO|nr:unnamed protein product [Mytilus coruscus]
MCYLSDTSQGKSYPSQEKRILTTPYSKPQSSVDIDPYGRPKLFHKGKEICNYYLAVNSSDFDLYTDAASTVGFEGYLKNRWFQASWPVEMKLNTELSLSMAYMELYPIVIAAIIWGNEWSGKRILFHCDNIATVLIIKKGRSKSLEIMRLMRRLTWCFSKYNVIIHATHVAGKCNTIADALSRLQMDRSRQLCPTASVGPCHCPPHSETLWN